MRLESVSMPSAYRMRYDLPTLGVEGTRARTGLRDTILIGTIIKPNVGMSAAETAGLVDTLCRAGVDLIKDAEVFADQYHPPLAELVHAVLSVVREPHQSTGQHWLVDVTFPGETDPRLPP